MHQNLVSVIIPTYNRAETIQRAIHSCLNQTYPFIEIIIIDDGSSDDTKHSVLQIARDNNDSNKHIRCIYQSNSGACVARNTGMDNAQGEYIQFLDSDDTMEPYKIEKQMDALKKRNAPCALCDFKYIDNHGKIIKQVKNDGDIHEYTSKLRSVSIMTPLIKKQSILYGLRWNPALKRNQDMDFMFKYFLTIEKWCYVPGAYCNYIVHEQKRISDSYHKGMQFYEMYKSFTEFYKKNKKLIPVANSQIVYRYRNELIKRWIKFNIKKYIPHSIKTFIRSRQTVSCTKQP
jgi:glycosyltransferase involved in cell wall biosynthesis